MHSDSRKEMNGKSEYEKEVEPGTWETYILVNYSRSLESAKALTDEIKSKTLTRKRPTQNNFKIKQKANKIINHERHIEQTFEWKCNGKNKRENSQNK